MKQFTKVVALICSVALLMGLIPTAVFATNDQTSDTIDESAISSVDVSATDEILTLESLTAEDIIGEAEELRDAQTKHFMLTDGSFVAVSYPVAVHEKVDGEWIELDNSLSDITDAEGYSLTQTASRNVRYAFVNGKGNRRLIKAEDTRVGAEVVFELVNADKKNIVLSENEATDELFAVENVLQKGTYVDILPNTDIEYIIAGTSLKENIIVHDAESVGTVSFVLRCKNVTAALQADNSVMFADTNGNTVFTIPAPFMTDAAGAYSDAVAVTLTPHKKGYLYTVTPSSEWTGDPTRVYPITIDPMMETDMTLTNEGDAVWGKTDRSFHYPSAYLPVGAPHGFETGALIYMEIPSEITSSCQIIDAAMRVYCKGALGAVSGNSVIVAYQYGSEWDHTQTEVAFDAEPIVVGSVLDYAIVSEEVPQGHISFDITEAAQRWITTDKNNGILLRSNNIDNCIVFASHDADSLQLPVTMYQYRDNKGIEDYWTYTSVSAGKNGAVGVNNYTGNTVYLQPIIEYTEELPLDLTWVYSANASVLGWYGNVGIGATTNYHITVGEEMSEMLSATYPYYIIDADGSKHYFVVKPESEEEPSLETVEYIDEDNLGYVLTVDNDETDTIRYRVSDTSGQTMLFDHNGHLSSIVDENGEVIITVSTATTSIGFLIHSISSGDKTVRFIYESIGGRNRVNYIQFEDDIYDLQYDGFYLTKIVYPDGQEVSLTYTDTTESAKCLQMISNNQNTLNTTMSYYSVAQNNQESVFARVSQLSYAAGNEVAVSYNFTYKDHMTDIEDGTGRVMTYQFNNHGHTVGIVNHSTGQGQYYEYGLTGDLTTEGLSQVNELKMVSNTMQSNVNLLENPHMMNQANNPWSIYTEVNDQTCQFQWVTDKGHSDDCSALLVQVNGNPAGHWLRQSVSNLEAGDYTASAYVTTNGVTLTDTGVRLKVEILNENNVVVRTAYSQPITTTAQNEWKQLMASFSLAQGEKVRICVGTDDAVGGFWVDDVCLEDGEVAGAYNLLLNSSFETIFAWDGTYSLSSKAACVEGDPISAAGISQTVAVNRTNGNNISFGAWAKAPSVATNPRESLSAYGKVGQPTFALELVFLDNTATEIESSSVMVPYNDGTDDWQYVCGGAEIPETAAFAKLVLHYDYNLGTACFDDAFVYLADYVAYKTTEDEAVEDETDEEPYDYSQDTQWYSDIITTSTDENGNMIETQVSQTISGTVSTDLVADEQYYVINAATGEALYTPSTTVDQQVYLRPLVAEDDGYVWTLRKPGSYQLGKSAGAGEYDLTFTSDGIAVLQTHTEGLQYYLSVSIQEDHSVVLGTGASMGSKNLAADATIATDDDYLTTVVHATGDAASKTQKWLFVPCDNNAYIQTQTAYDADGNMLSQTDERGNTTTYTYDADGNVLSMTDPKGNVTTYTYDANGNVTAMQNGDSAVSYTYTKDMLAAVEKDNTTSADGGEVFYSFVSDAFDRPLNVTVGDGETEQSLVSYAYNPRHLLSSLTYGNGADVSYTYDDVDLITSIKYNGNEKFSFAYTDNNQMALIKDFADNRRTRLVYDATGNVSGVLVTDDANSDGGNELLYKEYLSTDSADGFVVSVNNDADIIQLVKTGEYNQAEGLLLNGEEVITYSYDEFGRVIGRKVNTDTARNETLTYVAGSGANSTTNLVKTYNNTQRTYQYSYDVNGNLSAVSEGIAVRVYQYDELGQMVEERDRYTNTTTQYTYDDGGNLLQKAVYPNFYGANGTPTIITYTYGNSAWADQLTNYNGTTITYDSIGNPLNWRNDFTFTWQNGRELASATNTSTSVTYTYNQNGIRTSKTVNGVKTTYVLDENDLLMGEIIGENTIVYLYDENSSIYGFVYNGTPYFYLFNAQGDVMNVVDEAGTVVATYNYDAWGKVITATGDMAAINPIRYRGYYYDAETELYYLQSRYYDAKVTRFLNSDDVVCLGGTGSINSHNVFVYCENNSIRFEDPTGYVSSSVAVSTNLLRGVSVKYHSKRVSCLYGGFVYQIAFSTIEGTYQKRHYAKVANFTIKVYSMFRGYSVTKVHYYYGSSNIFFSQRNSGKLLGNARKTYFSNVAPSKWKAVNTAGYESMHAMVGVSVDVYFRRGRAEYHLYFTYTLFTCEFWLYLKNTKNKWEVVDFG